MTQDTFRCRHMGISVLTSDCIKNYERANTPGVEARWDEDDPCFSCPQGQETMSNKRKTEDQIRQISNPQPSRKLCDEDYVKIVEDLKRKYVQGEILLVPDFIKKSETFAKLSLAAREEFWFKAISQGLVDFLRHNQYKVILKKITLPSFEDLLTGNKPTSTPISITTVTKRKTNASVVIMFRPEAKPKPVKGRTKRLAEEETKAKRLAKEEVKKQAEAEAKAKRLAKEEVKKQAEAEAKAKRLANKMAAKKAEAEAKAKKQAELAAKIHLGKEIILDCRRFLIYICDGNEHCYKDKDLPIVSGCTRKDISFESWLLYFTRTGVVSKSKKFGDKTHRRPVFLIGDIDIFNNIAIRLGYNDLIIKTPPPTAL